MSGWYAAGIIYLMAWYGISFAIHRHGKKMGMPLPAPWMLPVILIPWPLWLVWYAAKGAKP